jgi:hypothetical protein
MTPQQFNHCLHYTVSQMKSNSDRACYANVEALKAAMNPSIFYIKFEDMPVLCWDVSLGALPSLKTGQHRRLALILKNNIPRTYHPDQEIDETNKFVSRPSILLIGRSI